MRARRWVSFFLVLFLFAPFVADGSPKADYQSGVAAYKGGKYSRAFQKFLALAKEGYASAQSNVAVMYRLGRGVKRNYTEAARWFRHAAEKGISSAQNNLGLLYAEGKGVLRDNVLAYMWLHLSHLQGSAKAGWSRDQIGLKMTSGQIVEARKRAEAWWLRPRPSR